MKNSNILGLFRTRAKAPGLLAVGVLALSQTFLSPAAFAVTDETAAGQVSANRLKLNAIKTQSYQLPPTRAKNVILFVGDGMGVSTITAARILQGQTLGMTSTTVTTRTKYDGSSITGGTVLISGEQSLLSFEQFPNAALSRTYSVNQQVSDSAPTMTAMVTGVKTNDGMLGVAPDVNRTSDITAESQKLTTIAEQCKARGMAVGIVTTARVTHATPAGCYAHTSERNYECDADNTATGSPYVTSGTPYSSYMPHVKDIAAQLLDCNNGASLDVVLGGGRKYFMKKNQEDPEYAFMSGGRTVGGRDLISEWKKLPNRAWNISAGTYSGTTYADNPRSAYVWNSLQFGTITAANTDRLLGLFEPSHVQYEADRALDHGGEPSLADMTTKAIQILKKNRNGFFLMVEGGRIDHAHHAGNAYRALTDTLAFAAAVDAAQAQVGTDTLIVVTADHSHTFTIAGYPERGNPILGYVVEPTSTGSTVTGVATTSRKVTLDKNGLPYLTLGYANGPGYIAATDLTMTTGTLSTSGSLLASGTEGLTFTMSGTLQGIKFATVNHDVPTDLYGVIHNASYLTSNGTSSSVSLASNTYTVTSPVTQSLTPANGLTGTRSVTVSTGTKYSPRPNLFSVDLTNINLLQEATVPTTSETHGGEDVAIFAKGPNAHLFRGSLEQSMIYWIMADALRLNP